MDLSGDYAESYALAKALLAQPPLPTAILAFCDHRALLAMKAIREAGLSIPQDIAVCGFEGHAHMDLMEPPLATVFKDSKKMGQLAGDLIVKMIKNERVHPRAADKITLKPKLLARESMTAAR